MKIEKFNYTLLSVLVVYFPFQALSSNFLEFNTKLSSSETFWLVHWYEPVILMLLAAMLIIRMIKKRRFEFGLSQILAMALLALGVFSILFSSSSVTKGFEGFRFTLFGLVFYMFAFEAGFNKEKAKKLINVYLWTSAFVAFWALIERFLPYNYWGLWHIANPQVVFGYGWHNVAFVKQSASVLGGPNQLASYLLPAFFISFSRMIKFTKGVAEKNTKLYLAFTILLNFAIFISFSRSAILALLIILVVYTYLTRNKWARSYSLFMILLVLVIFILAIISKENAFELITHGRSQSEHSLALNSSLVEIKSRIIHPITLLFGAGLGSAGPLAIKYGDGIISESWYLQLVLEIGLIGLFLWITFIFLMMKDLLQRKEFGLLLGLAAVSTTAIFLHTFADNPALTYTLFILIGLNLNSELQHEKNFS